MSAIQSQSAAEANRIQRLARLKKFDEVETALIKAIEADLITAEDVYSVLEVVSEQNDPNRTESLAWIVLSISTERRGPQGGVDIARRLATLLPQSETLRTESIELYRKAYAEKIPQFDALMEMTLLRKGTPLSVTVQQLEKLLELRSQPYVLDRKTNTPGRIVGLDAEKRAVIVSLSGKEQSFDISEAVRFDALPDTDFRALATFDRENLAQSAKEDPEQFAIFILKTFGPTLSFRDFKAQATLVLPSSAWTKWWADAKHVIHRSAMIEMTASNQPTLTLRSKPLAYEDRVRREFVEINSVEDQLVMILDYISRHQQDATPDEKTLRLFNVTLRENANTSNQALKLAVRTVLAELHQKFPQHVPTTSWTTEPIQEPATLLNSIYNDDVAKLILTTIRQANPDTWYDLFASIMPGASAGVCEWIASELTKEGTRESFTRTVETILHWPERFPRAIVWLFKTVTAENRPDYVAQIDQTTILTGLATAAQILKRKSPIADAEQTRRALAQIKNAISANDFAFVRAVLESANYDYAGYLKDTLPRNTGLGDAITSDLIKILRETHPALFAQKPVPPWEEDAVYTTHDALEKKNQEYAKLVNVDIPHNAKTIGDAAEKGDLRENAEFTAALEERDRLNERAMRMRSELKKARTIYPGMANTDHVTIGSIVKAQNLSTNETETYQFLGPWDANHEKGIYSYLSPMALSFMGKKVGETVIHVSNAGETRWKILEITPGV